MAGIHALGQRLIDDADPLASAWVERLRGAGPSRFNDEADEALVVLCRTYVRELGRYLLGRDDRALRGIARREAEKRFESDFPLDDLVGAYRSLQDLLWDRTSDRPAGAPAELGLWDLSGAIVLSIEDTVTAYQTLLSRQWAARRGGIDTLARVQQPTTVDELTSLFAAGVFHEYLPREIQRARRYARALSLLVIDIDDYSRLADLCGTAEADRVVRELAEMVPRCVREVDIMCRLETDKFAAILPETPVLAATSVAERVRGAAEQHAGFSADVRSSGPVRVSVGVAGFPEDASTAEELLTRADAACAHAKRLGKNQVAVFSETRR